MKATSGGLSGCCQKTAASSFQKQYYMRRVTSQPAGQMEKKQPQGSKPVLGSQIIPKTSAQPKMRFAESLVRDKNDAPILAAFLASDANYLMTGDKDLLSIGRKDIVNARAALEIIGKPAK